MGARGPARTPTAILAQRGSTLTRGRIRTEPEPPDGQPGPPAWLTPAAADVWPEVVEILDAVPGLLTTVDGWALGRYCEAFVDWVRCVAFVRENGEGRMVPKYDKSGNEIGEYYQYYPEASSRLKYEKLLAVLEAKFGLTPADRSRVVVAKQPSEVPDKSRFFGATA